MPVALIHLLRLFARQRKQLLQAIFDNRIGKTARALAFLKQGARKMLQPAALHRCLQGTRGQKAIQPVMDGRGLFRRSPRADMTDVPAVSARPQ